MSDHAAGRVMKQEPTLGHGSLTPLERRMSEAAYPVVQSLSLYRQRPMRLRSAYPATPSPVASAHKWETVPVHERLAPRAG